MRHTSAATTMIARMRTSQTTNTTPDLRSYTECTPVRPRRIQTDMPTKGIGPPPKRGGFTWSSQHSRNERLRRLCRFRRTVFDLVIG